MDYGAKKRALVRVLPRGGVCLSLQNTSWTGRAHPIVALVRAGAGTISVRALQQNRHRDISGRDPADSVVEARTITPARLESAASVFHLWDWIGRRHRISGNASRGRHRRAHRRIAALAATARAHRGARDRILCLEAHLAGAPGVY